MAFPQQHQQFAKADYNALSPVIEAGRDACASKHPGPARRLAAG
jgi:hypothetical protein